MAGGEPVLSVEDALWAAHKQGGSARREQTTVQRALSGLDQHGHAHEAAWPYGSPAFPASRPRRARRGENRCRLGPWRRLDNARYDTLIPDLEQGLSAVVTVRFVPLAWQDDGWVDADAGGIVEGGHAVLAVGAQQEAASVPNHVIIKNSWGPNWGAEGYGFISERYLRHYGIVAHVLEGCQ
jgi:C1A family cysteine protease